MSNPVNICSASQPLRIDRRSAMATVALVSLGAFLPWRGAEAQALGLRGYLRTNWSLDPYAFGSYSYVAKGSRQRDRRDLGAPVSDRLFFAGEATHPDHNSTVHSAYESGILAANSVGQTNARNVAIVGAGMSGLTAAHALAKKGIAVTIFEARNRIGGRIWTNHDLGFPLDLGASWIHGTRGNPIAKLARRAQAKTVPTDERYIIRGQGGRHIRESDAPDWLENVVSIQHDAGADSSQLNLQAYMDQPEYGGKQVIFPSGYESILSALSGPYEIRLSEKVKEISYDNNGVVVTTAHDQESFDSVVVTLPLGVLKQGSVAFRPGLPEANRRAINRLGMGTLDKLCLLFEEPLWDKSATWIATPENGLPQGQFNQWLNLSKYLDAPIIMALNGGPPAIQLSRRSDDELVRLATASLRMAH